MPILEINRLGYRPETSEVMTERGVIVIENLIPDEADNEAIKTAETVLYDIFSKYKITEQKPDKSLTVGGEKRRQL